jgi:DNA-binding response OmpR family regulator
MPSLTERPLSPQGDIMIVDDNPANLRLLEDMLLQQGHEVRSFPLGRLALAAAIEDPPNLILLDVNMPEMDGFEVCKRLKANEEVSGVPVIFLSALSETQDKVKAFRSGAADYISKPFQLEEVQARVETHLKLHDLQQALKLHNENLEKAVASRTGELAQANERLTILDSSKSEFLDLISHEFRTPLCGLLAAGELILEGMPCTPENNELQGMFERSRRRILSILDDALLMTRIGMEFRVSAAPVSLGGALRQAIKSAAPFAKSRDVALVPLSEHPDFFVLGDEHLLVRALHALLETAVKFSEKGEPVRLSWDDVPDSRGVIIESQGRTIPSSALSKFFDLFSIAETITPGGDLGLGPPLASRILSLFGASVSVRNRAPSGIRLTISLKHAPGEV